MEIKRNESSCENKWWFLLDCVNLWSHSILLIDFLQFWFIGFHSAPALLDLVAPFPSIVVIPLISILCLAIDDSRWSMMWKKTRRNWADSPSTPKSSTIYGNPSSSSSTQSTKQKNWTKASATWSSWKAAWKAQMTSLNQMESAWFVCFSKFRWFCLVRMGFAQNALTIGLGLARETTVPFADALWKKAKGTKNKFSLWWRMTQRTQSPNSKKAFSPF